MSIYAELSESEDMDEDKRESTAADRIAVTNIIPGLLTSLLIQGRTSINGTNLVGQYIAASTVKISSRNGLSLRNPNQISRSQFTLQVTPTSFNCASWPFKNKIGDTLKINFRRTRKDTRKDTKKLCTRALSGTQSQCSSRDLLLICLIQPPYVVSYTLGSALMVAIYRPALSFIRSPPCF